MRDDQKRALLEIAREAVHLAASHEDPMRAADGAAGVFDELGSDKGAFVSLHTHDHRLRGCVGCMTGSRPVAEVVAEMACAAARRDPRFSPVESNELEDLVIEISVLSPTEPIASLEDIVVGRDGLLAIQGSQQGVLLPQVASQRGWDAMTFAGQTCLKANLAEDAWRGGDATLYRFAAEVFSESAEPARP
jgi:AmmeMemoRadiSam system protein A